MKHIGIVAIGLMVVILFAGTAAGSVVAITIGELVHGTVGFFFLFFFLILAVSALLKRYT